jgi:uncharacterized protein YndB with AHSA1/START domain
VYSATVKLQVSVAPSAVIRNQMVARTGGGSGDLPPGLGGPPPLDDVEVRRSALLDAPPAVVWESLTRPNRLSGWLGGAVDIDLRPGGRGSVQRADGELRRIRVEAVEPLRRLAFRWWPFEAPGSLRPGGASRVELLLEETPGGTWLTVTERPAPGPMVLSAAEGEW